MYDIKICPSCGTPGKDNSNSSCCLSGEEQYTCPKCDAIWGRLAPDPYSNLPAVRYFHPGEEVRQLIRHLEHKEEES